MFLRIDVCLSLYPVYCRQFLDKCLLGLMFVLNRIGNRICDDFRSKRLPGNCALRLGITCLATQAELVSAIRAILCADFIDVVEKLAAFPNIKISDIFLSSHSRIVQKCHFNFCTSQTYVCCGLVRHSRVVQKEMPLSYVISVFSSLNLKNRVHILRLGLTSALPASIY